LFTQQEAGDWTSVAKSIKDDNDINFRQRTKLSATRNNETFQRQLEDIRMKDKRIKSDVLEYWKNQMQGPRLEKRELWKAIDDLYKYNQIYTDRSLRPLVDFFEAKPEQFSIYDADINHKAIKHMDVEEKNRLTAQSNKEREERVAKIFQDVKRSMRKMKSSNEKEKEQKMVLESFEHPFGKRKNKGNLKFLEYNNVTVVIDQEMIAKEENKANVQCSENLNAYNDFKIKKLFPNNRRDMDEKRQKKKVIVQAAKTLQKSLEMRN
jgi:hypothetical protein